MGGEGDANPKCCCANIAFWPIVLENCMKLKKSDCGTFQYLPLGHALLLVGKWKKEKELWFVG